MDNKLQTAPGSVRLLARLWLVAAAVFVLITFLAYYTYGAVIAFCTSMYLALFLAVFFIATRKPWLTLCIAQYFLS